MTRQYNIEEIRGKEIIWYEENGVRYSFIADPANSDYQRYLLWLENPEAEHFTPMVTDAPKS
jgi:hypothetical protein